MQCTEYCRWLNWFIRNNIGKLNHGFFFNKVWMHLDRYINSQNFRMWPSENPDAFMEKGLYLQKIGVWCAILRKRVVGPFFSHETLNMEHYQSINGEFITSLRYAPRLHLHWSTKSTSWSTLMEKSTYPHLRSFTQLLKSEFEKI